MDYILGSPRIFKSESDKNMGGEERRNWGRQPIDSFQAPNILQE